MSSFLHDNGSILQNGITAIFYINQGYYVNSYCVYNNIFRLIHFLS